MMHLKYEGQLESRLKHSIHCLNVGLLCLLGVFMCVSTAATNIISIVLMVLFLMTGDYHNKLRCLKHPLVWPLIALFFLTFLGCFYAHYGMNIPWKDSFKYLDKMRKLWIVWVVIYHLTYLPKRDEGKFSYQQLFTWAFFIGVALNVVAIYLNAFVLGVAHAIVFSTPTFPAAQSHFVTGFIFALSAFLLFGIGWSYRVKKPQYCWVILLLGVIVLIAEVGINSSRTGYVIEFCVIVYGFLHRYGIKGFFIGIFTAVGVMLIAYHLSGTFKVRVNQAYGNVSAFYQGAAVNTSAGLRLGWGALAFKTYHRDPKILLTGCGTGALKSCTQATLDKEVNVSPQMKLKEGFENPHNQYIYFLTQSGLLALGLFLFVLLNAFFKAGRLTAPQNVNLKILLITFSVGCLFNSWILDIGPGFIFLYLLTVFGKNID